MNQYNQPPVPFLYFEMNGSNNTDVGNIHDSSDRASFLTPELPSELLSHCLASYADWGDLAKLACVQRSWKNIVTDTANQSTSSKWELATALFNGDCGLAKNPVLAFILLKEISNVTSINDGENSSYQIDDVKEREYASLAMMKIAECYLGGIGVQQKDGFVAISWLEKAFYVGNDPKVARKLAVIYEKGGDEDTGNHCITEINIVIAAEWYKRGAELGDMESMTELALCYELGCGVDQNEDLALDWYTKAADLGDITAKFSIGEIYEQGLGVPQSETEACVWYYSAAIDGCKDSKIALHRLYDIAQIVVPGVNSILE